MGRIEADIALEKLAVCISALFRTLAVYPTYMIQANFQLVLAPKNYFDRPVAGFTKNESTAAMIFCPKN